MGKSNGGVWDESFVGSTKAEEIINALYRPSGPCERWGKARIARCIPLIDPKPGQRILDLACGFGTFTYLCAKLGAQVTGIDLSEVCLKTAYEACSRFQIDGAYSYICGDVATLPFSDNSFDKLISIDGFEHFPWNVKRALVKQAHRVLKPGGSLIIYTPNILTKATKVLRLNLKNLALGRLERLTTTREYLEVQEPTHIGMVSPFKLRRLFRSNQFKLRFHYDVSRGKKRRSAWRILTQEKMPLFRDLLNGRIALIAERTG